VRNVNVFRAKYANVGTTSLRCCVAAKFAPGTSRTQGLNGPRREAPSLKVAK